MSSHGQEAENGLIWERVKILVDKKKNTGWIFSIVGWLYTKLQTQLVKVHAASDDPFNGFLINILVNLKPWSKQALVMIWLT